MQYQVARETQQMRKWYRIENPLKKAHRHDAPEAQNRIWQFGFQRPEAIHMKIQSFDVTVFRWYIPDTPVVMWIYVCAWAPNNSELRSSCLARNAWAWAKAGPTAAQQNASCRNTEPGRTHPARCQKMTCKQHFHINMLCIYYIYGSPSLL